MTGWWRALFERLRPPAASPARPVGPDVLGERAARALAAALAENDPLRRAAGLREALALADAAPGEAGDVVAMEASLHLGERLRAMGARDEAARHFARALERSLRVPDPLGRHRRAGVLSRLAILDQEAGHEDLARERYREALALGADTDSQNLLGMLTQAAFNLGLLESERGADDAAAETWMRALDLGQRSGHAGGWDPAAVAAFNLGHLWTRRGDVGRARAMLERVGAIAQRAETEGGGATPLAHMASAKAALSLASLAEQEGLLGEPESARQYRRAYECGLASGLPEGALAALQGALGLGERAVSGGRFAEASERYREALALVPGCEREPSERFALLATLRLGQTLAELGEYEEAAVRLRGAFDTGRASQEAWMRELAGQAACNLHRVLSALDRWDDARALAEESVAFTRTLTSGTGRALEAAAAYARAFQALHDGRPDDTLAQLDDVVRLGHASGVDVGERIALDALLLTGHLQRQAGRHELAVRAFRDALATLRDREPDMPAPAEADAVAAMASVNLGHALLALERAFDARNAYESALERGRSSGLPAGRAAAANAALNLGAMLAGEMDDARRRELFEIARALGRSSGTPLGSECATQAERAIERLDAGDDAS